jgi:hypothetical protein
MQAEQNQKLRGMVRISGAKCEFKMALFRQNKYFPFAFGLGKQIARCPCSRKYLAVKLQDKRVKTLICSIIMNLSGMDGEKMVGSGLGFQSS